MTEIADVLEWQRRFVRRAGATTDPEERGQILDEMLRERSAGWDDPDVRVRPVDVGGVEAEWIESGAEHVPRVVLFLHGGGFVGGATRYDRPLLGRLARDGRARVLGVDYRLAPAHPFPAAVDDALAAYRWVLDSGTAPEDVVVVCESAGSTVGLLALLELHDLGIPTPAGVSLISPFVDLTLSGRSMQSPSSADPMVSAASLSRGVRAFLGGRDEREHSPLFRDLAGLPRLQVQAGDVELLGDDARRLVVRAVGAGVDASLVEYAGTPHTWQGFPGLAEATQVSDEVARFVDRCCSARV